MGYEINRVAVLGAGVMGQGIAAHLANAGIPSVLFDIVPDGAEDRSILARKGIQNAKKLKPAAFFRKDGAELITAANYEDDGALLGECDWIIEVVVERLKIKNIVFDWVEKNRKPGSIVSSNTSGLSLADMAAEMSEEMRQHFLVTHFFNPVRYMRLLELVEGPDTLPAVTAAVAEFGASTLGKGIVYAKDTPNFIANRIGTYGIVSVFEHMGRFGLSVEAVDAIAGKPMGRPASAVFRTADLVGLDTLSHVLATVYNSCPDDEARERFQTPPWMQQMIEEGALGSKSGLGFYKKVKEGGRSVILARDLETGEYRPTDKPRYTSVGNTKGVDEVERRVKILLDGDDDAAQFAWAVTADTLIYSARRIPEIADDVVNVDRGMRWGFGWDLGPFETWDAIGVAESVARMEAEGREVPGWVKGMLAAGRGSFYQRDANGAMTYWDALEGRSVTVPTPASWLILSDATAAGRIVASNDSADLIDIGDGVACLSFHSKMNAIDENIGKLYSQALDELDAGKWEALVVGNQGGNAFCAGANLFVLGMMAMQGNYAAIESQINDLQQLLHRAKYSARPVVAAPWGLALGGGCEIGMQASATVAAGELYMGLVEVGVGLIPGAGGCKEMVVRYLGDLPPGVDYDPNPFIQAAFKNIALASVSKSAEEARDMRYLRVTDALELDGDALIQSAKRAALGMVAGGYAPPRQRKVKLPGGTGRAAIELFLDQMRSGGYATDHDVTVGKKLAYVMTGGDVPRGTWLGEQDLLDLEREAFLSLCGEPKTHQRILHMLNTGKPLRN